MIALVSYSRKFESFLNPMIGFSVKIGSQSGLFEMIFKFLWIIPLILGFMAL